MVTRRHHRVTDSGLRSNLAARRATDQLEGDSLISVESRSTRAAGERFFGTADASMMRGAFGRGTAGAVDGGWPPRSGKPPPQSPDLVTSTVGGAPVPGSK